MKSLVKIIMIVAVSIVLAVGCSSNSQKLTKEQFDNNLKEHIDMANYAGNDKDSYSLKSDLHKDYEMDFALSLEKEEITMPAAFSELEKQGWEIVNEKYLQMPLKAKAMSNTICSKKGKNINVFAVNNTDKNILFPQGTICRITLELYSADDNYKKKLDTAPDFTVLNSINNKSSFDDIIKVLGNPVKIENIAVNDKCSKMVLLYQNISDNDWIKFELTADGKKIVNVDYSTNIL